MIQQYEVLVAWMQAKFGVDVSDEKEGQGLVEYALILVLISVVAIVAMRPLGAAVAGIFDQITAAL